MREFYTFNNIKVEMLFHRHMQKNTMKQRQISQHPSSVALDFLFLFQTVFYTFKLLDEV